MLNENKRRKYSPIDPYMSQSTKDFTQDNYDLTTNKKIQIHDYSQFGYEKLRDKRQILPDEMEEIWEKADTPEQGKSQEPAPKDDDNVKPVLYPLYIITILFATVLIIGPLLVRKGPHRGIVRSSIMLTAFCMWIFWFTIYFGQMNPLMGPRLANTTVAWIAYKLGDPVGMNKSRY